MAKASLKLLNGTTIILEGSPEEVEHLLGLYGGEDERATRPAERSRGSQRSKSLASSARSSKDQQEGRPDLNKIVTLVKDCDEAEAIEKQILDRTAQVDRTLLPLYIVHEYLDNAFGFTSGDVAKITIDLGIPISQPAASRTLSGNASKYVIGDKVKIKGQPVHYKLSRRGVRYMKDVLTGKADD